MKRFLILIMLLCLTGCVQGIDKRWAAVNAKARDANLAFTMASVSFVNGVDKMVANKHGLQQEHINRDWDEFYKEYSDANGNVPVNAVKERVLQATEDVHQLELSKLSWEEYKTKYLDAINKLEQATYSTEATEEEILAAKESAQAYLNAALGILGGVAAGALLVP